MNKIYNRENVHSGSSPNTRKSWRFSLALLFGMFLSIASFAQNITVGSGTLTTTNAPIYGLYNFSYSQILYTSADLTTAGYGGGAGTIEKIRFYVTSLPSTPAQSNNWTVYIGNTALTTMTAGSANYVPASEMTSCFSGTVSFPATANNWMEITLSTPFSYTGGNLIIAVDENSANYSGVTFRGTAATGMSRVLYSDTVNPDPAALPGAYSGTSATSANRPNIQLTFQSLTPPSCAISHSPADAATSVARNATLTWAEGPGGPTSYDVYFGTATNPALVGNQTGTSYTPAVLAANTQYFWKVVPKNVNGSATGCVERSFTTGADFSYCTPSSTASGTYINNFSTTLGTTNIANATGYTTGGYQNNFGGTAVTSYATGSFNYNFTVVGGTLGAAIWIDWNVNGVFETGERVFVTSSYGSGPYAGTINVPLGTALGDYRMRVMVDYNNGSPSNPCMTVNARTETEDYKITVSTAPSCAAPTALTSSNVLSTTATLNWTASASSPTNGYDIYYSTTNTAPLVGTTPTVNNHTASPLNATGLTSSSTYYWWVRSDCGDTSTWASGGSFATTQIAGTLPYTQDFSGSNGFSFINGSQINQWVNGSGAGNTGNSIYISNDSGVTNAYNNASTSVTQAYRDIAIPNGTTLASLFFDWQANGESGYDYLRVWLVPTSFIPTAGTQIAAGTGRIQVGTNFGLQTTWQNYSNGILDLSSFANSTMRLVFEWTNDSSGGTQTPAAVDNISLTIPSCIPPTALVASAVTATTATLSWTASTSTPTNGYDIYYSTTNTAPLAGTTPSVNNHTASPLNATGLADATIYYWWVRSDCGGETSTWASGGSFQTLCLAFTIPYSENFDATATGSSTVPSAPICWSYLETAAGAGYGYTYAFGTPNTSPNHFFLTNSSDSSGSYMLVSPNTNDLSNGLNRVRLYAKGSAGYTLVLGTLSDPLDVNSFTAIQSIALTATYTEYTVNIPAGTDSYLVFKHGLGGTYRSIYIDNVTVENIPSCLMPTALASSAITTTTATLSWTASASTPANGYDIYYSTTSSAPLAGTTPTVNNHTASPLNATGLTSSSTYYWWVRSDCGDTSTWASGGSFTTPCSATTVPYSENFESAIVPALPNCTANQNVGTGNNWVTVSNPGTGFTTKALKYGYAAPAANTWFFTQGITLQAGKPYVISYDYGSSSTSYIEKMKVAVGTSPANTSMTNVLADYDNINQAALQSATVPFTPDVTGVYYFGFNAYSDADRYNLYLDNIKVEAACPAGVWIGTTSDFSTASNWADNMVPEACTNITVNVANPVVISSDVTVTSLTLGATAVVTVNGTLNVGNISVATGGMLTVANDAAVLQTDMATNTGMVTVKRNSASLFRQDYTLWSSPVSGQNLRAFSTQTLFNRFSSYDTALGTNGNYVQEIVTVADMNAKMFGTAKGYLIRMPNNWIQVGGSALPYLGSFTGTLNNGAVFIALSGANNKFNLVGNPYASPISIASLFAANTNIDETLYFWRKQGSELSLASGYATYTSLGMVSADLSINGTIPTNIEAGQGFFVVANSVTPGNLVLNNTMRNNGAATFYKGTTTTELNRMWLNLSNATTVVGQTLIGYATGATQGVDAGVDAMYFNDSQTALTSLINDAEYIIQGRSLPFVNSDIVPLGFKSEVAGNFTISLSNFDGLFAENQDIFLKDNVTGTVQNLKLANYTFATPVGVYNTRFEVLYTNSTLGTDNPISADHAILIGVKDQKININAGSVVMEKIELIDVAGRVIYTKEGVNATTATLENVVSANQMLIVRISTVANGVVNQKIIF